MRAGVQHGEYRWDSYGAPCPSLKPNVWHKGEKWLESSQKLTLQFF